MNYEFSEHALREAVEAANYYDSQKDGLGDEFEAQLNERITMICQFPQSGSPLSKRYRRTLFPRFPYGLIYEIKQQTIHIVAVMHMHKRPGYWKKRTR